MSPLYQIQHHLQTAGNKSSTEFFQKMVPGEQKSYGVKSPVLNELAKRYSAHSFALAEELWKAGALEEKIIAIKIIERMGKKEPAKVLPLFRKFAKQIDNWAVCDGLGMQFLRGIVKTHPKEIFELAFKYKDSKDPWQRRLSLVMVEWYTRDKAMHADIRKLVMALDRDEEYYVKKAVAWIKRNLGS
ncbi:MAG: DNA alkylation repair protein [Chitinophagaceae bacterium]|nr:DNA alkylation repair protein [Chitinophagaceae bacterium]